MYIDKNWNIHPEVLRLYEKYKDEMGLWSPGSEYNNNKKYYVYIWFTLDEGKVFYVGKGTGNRVKHILYEIKTFEKNKKKYKGKLYKELNDIHGINYRIVLNNLSDFEAQIYEFCLMREYTSQGEVLLNLADMPIDENYYINSTPTITKPPYYERYFNDYTIPTFDEINVNSLKSSFLQDSFITAHSFFEKREQIISWIESAGGRIFKSNGKRVRCIIVFGKYDYGKYIEDRLSGKKIYSYLDVIEFISKNNIHPQKKRKSKTSVPNYETTKRDKIREYLKNNSNNIDMLANTKGNGYEEQIKGYELKKQGNDTEAFIFLLAAVQKGFDSPELYIQLGILYRKYGLFNEEVNMLNKAIEKCDFNDACLSRITDRLRKAKQIYEADSEANKS